MFNSNILVFVICVYSASAVEDIIPTTTRTYDIDVPGSEPIRIIEGEPLWENQPSTEIPKSRFSQRSLNVNDYTTVKTKTNLNYPLTSEDDDRNTSEFAPGALQEFLSSYAEKIKRGKPGRQEDIEDDTVEISNPTEETTNRLASLMLDEEGPDHPEKSKSWSLLHYQKHNHPYDDKKGWVSLEPVPWSVSKISKWQSNYKPNPKPLEESALNEKPWDNDFGSSYEQPITSWNTKPYKPLNSNKPTPNFDRYDVKPTDHLDLYDKPSYGNYNKPSNNFDKYDVYVLNKPDGRPSFTKPSAIYAQKVHLQQAPNYNTHHVPRPNLNKPLQDFYKNDANEEGSDIITDGLPPDFPLSDGRDIMRRRGSEMVHPDTHPLNGNGDWVLLSTTKGYKYPKNRQRSMEINTDSVGAHRGVRLTVLPPLKGSKINMTTSHGGLLQVESSFETVEQARKQLANKRLKQKRQKTKRPPKIVKRQQNKVPVQQIASPTVATLPRRNTAPDTSAVLAAVGAGMIPATMAMLVPMAMNGRRKRDTRFVTSNPHSSVEITLPRYL